MSDPDKSIERVLQGLRAVEPAPQLQARLLCDLERRSVRRASEGLSLGRRVPSRRFWITASFAVFLAMVVGHAWQLRQGANRSGRAAVPLQVSVERHASAAHLPPSIDHANAPTHRAIQLVVGEAVPQTPPVALRGRDRETTVPRAKTLAEQEAEAPSLLAPPLPLTKSERLLLQMTEQRRPEEIALLTGQLTAAHNAHDRREFSDFFEPSDSQHAQN